MLATLEGSNTIMMTGNIVGTIGPEEGREIIYSSISTFGEKE